MRGADGSGLGQGPVGVAGGQSATVPGVWDEATAT